MCGYTRIKFCQSLLLFFNHWTSHWYGNKPTKTTTNNKHTLEQYSKSLQMKLHQSWYTLLKYNSSQSYLLYLILIVLAWHPMIMVLLLYFRQNCKFKTCIYFFILPGWTDSKITKYRNLPEPSNSKTTQNWTILANLCWC